jgi:hypothetical protein
MTKSVTPPDQPTPQPPVDPTHQEKGPPPQYKGTDKPITWLHMHFTGPEAEKLWNSIIQQVNTSIQKDQARALKALRKLRKNETSSDD